MGDAVLRIDDLRKLTRLQRPADIQRRLESDGIVVFGKGEAIFTTANVIELAARVKLGLVKPEGKEPLL